MHIFIYEIVDIWDDVYSLNTSLSFWIVWKEPLEIFLVTKILGQEEMDYRLVAKI